MDELEELQETVDIHELRLNELEKRIESVEKKLQQIQAVVTSLEIIVKDIRKQLEEYSLKEMHKEALRKEQNREEKKPWWKFWKKKG